MLFPALFVFRWILFYRDFEWVREFFIAILSKAKKLSFLVLELSRKSVSPVFGEIKTQAPQAGKIKNIHPSRQMTSSNMINRKKGETFFLFFYFFLEKLL